MFLQHFIADYFSGLRASLQGFFVLHKLDTVINDEQTKTITEQQTKKEDVKALTVLQQRRKLASSSTTSSKPRVEELVPPKPTALKRVFQCMGLNVACVIALKLILLPVLRLFAYLLPLSVTEDWTADRVSSAVGAISILPVFIITRIVNALWFSDIANASLKYCGAQSVVTLSFSRAVADFLVAILVEVVFLLQSMLMVYLPIPIVAPFITFFHLSLLHALYSFEYFWMSKGYELKSRLAKIERCWPYFMGFGTPLTVISMMSESFIVNGCLFGMFFPFFIISSYMADTKLRSEESLSIPTVHIFFPSLMVTNRISAYISHIAAVRPLGQVSLRPSSSSHLMYSRQHHHSHSPMRFVNTGKTNRRSID